jgi:hypothetical protein
MELGDTKLRRLHPRLPTLKEFLLLLLGAVLALGCVWIVHYRDTHRVPLTFKQAGITSPWIPDTVKRWQDPINEMAKKYNVDPNLLAILMTLESGGSAKAESGQASGLMQITPGTAKDIASKYLKQPTTTYNLQDPQTNIEFGAAYVAYLRNYFGDYRQGPDWNSTVELIAAGYNGGPGAAGSVLKGTGLSDTQTVVYSRDAFNMWRERYASKSPTFDRWQERGGSELIDQAKAEK